MGDFIPPKDGKVTAKSNTNTFVPPTDSVELKKKDNLKPTTTPPKSVSGTSTGSSGGVNPAFKSSIPSPIPDFNSMESGQSKKKVVEEPVIDSQMKTFEGFSSADLKKMNSTKTILPPVNINVKNKIEEKSLRDELKKTKVTSENMDAVSLKTDRLSEIAKINKEADDLSESKPKDYSFLEYSKDARDSGLFTFAKSAFDTPELAYDFVTQNILNSRLEAEGSPYLLKTGDELADDLGLRNIPAQDLQEQITIANDKMKVYSDKNGGDALSAIQNGNYVGASKLIVGTTIQSAPLMVAVILSGGSVGGLTAVGVSSAATQNSELKLQHPEMDVKTRLNNAAASGVIEATVGALFTGASGAVAKKIIADKGVEVGSKIIAKSFRSTLEKVVSKNPIVAGIGEVAEETIVEGAHQTKDILSGIRQEYDIHAMGNAGISSTGMGGVNTLAVYGAKDYIKAKDYAKLKSTNKEVFKLRSEIDNGNLSPENKAILSLRADRLEAENKKLLGTEIEKAKALPTEQKTELNALNAEFEDLKSKFDDIDDADDIPENLKPAMKEEIRLQASKNQKRKTEILSQNDGLEVNDDFSKFEGVEPDFDLENGKISSLPLKEQDRLNDQALQELTGGDMSIEVTKEQVSQKANEIYENEQNPTTPTTEAQPQAEVQKPSETEKVETPKPQEVSPVEDVVAPSVENIPEIIGATTPFPSNPKVGDKIVSKMIPDEKGNLFEYKMVNPFETDYTEKWEDYDKIVALPSTQAYIEKYKNGEVPPPIQVIKRNDGEFTSLNRRRIVAAREAGVKSIPAWVEIDAKNEGKENGNTPADGNVRPTTPNVGEVRATEQEIPAKKSVPSSVDGGEVKGVTKIVDAKSFANKLRGKSTTNVDFKRPVIGKNGSKLISYVWEHEELIPAITLKDGSVAKPVRVSDWNKAGVNLDTGRGIVHKFKVETADGNIIEVSADSLAKALGFTSGELNSEFPKIKEVSKAIARLTLEEQSLLVDISEAQNQKAEIIKEIEKELGVTVNVIKSGEGFNEAGIGNPKDGESENVHNLFSAKARERGLYITGLREDAKRLMSVRKQLENKNNQLEQLLPIEKPAETPQPKSKGDVEVVKKVKSVKGATYDVHFDGDGNISKIISPKNGREIVKFTEREVNDLDAKGRKQKNKDGTIKKKKVLVSNPNYAQIEADALGLPTANKEKADKKVDLKVAVDNISETDPYSVALKALVNGEKVSFASIIKETGNKDGKWATNQSDKSLPSIEKLSEQLAEQNPDLDQQEIRNAIIDIISSHSNMNSVKESVIEIYNENAKKQQEQEFNVSLGSLSEKEMAMYESVATEDDYLSELTDKEQQEYFEQQYNVKSQEQIDDYEKGRNQNNEGGNKQNEGVQEGDGKQEKPTTKEKIAERIKLSDAKVDDLKAYIKGIDNIFGIKIKIDDVEGLNKNGIDFIEVIASIAKQAIAAGIHIDEAINKTIEHFKTKYDFDVNIDDIKAKIDPKAVEERISPKKEADGFKREKGKSSVLKRIREGGNSAEINEIIDNIGLNYEGRKQEQVYADGVNFVKEVGVVEAYNAIKNGELKDSDTINVVYATILQEFTKMAENEMSKVSDPQELNDLVQELDDFHQKIYTEFKTRTIDAGRGSAILNFIYNQDLKIRYSLSQQIENFKKVNNGVVPAETLAKMKELDKQYQEANKRIEELETLLQEAQEQKDFENIVEEGKRQPKLSKTKREKAEKIIKALDDFEKSILQNNYSDATMITPILIQGIRATKLAIKQGVNIAEAIEKGIEGIKKELEKLGKTFDNEERFRNDLNKSLEGIETDIKESKVTVDKKGKVRIPTEMIKEYISKGGTDLSEFASQVRESIKDEFPDVTVRDIRESVANYGKKANKSKSQIVEDIQKLKSEERLRLQYEDLQNRISKEKNEVKKQTLSQTQKRLKEQIKQLQDDLGITETERTNRSVNYTKKRIEILREKIKNNDFAKKEIKPIVESQELKDAKIEKNRVQEEFDYLSYQQELANRTIGDKALELLGDLYDSQRVTLATGELSFVGAQGAFYMIDSTFSRKTLKNLIENFKGTTVKEWKSNPFGTALKMAKSAHSGESLIKMFNTMGTANNYMDFQRLLKESPDYDLYLKMGLRLLGEDVKSQVKDDNFIGNNILNLLRVPIHLTDRIEKKELLNFKLKLAEDEKKRTTVQGYYEKLKTGKVSDKNKKTATEMFTNANPLSTFERGNNTFMNMARKELADIYIAELRALGKNPIDHIADFKDLGSAINTITGSGNMGPKTTMFLPKLNAIMFSARYFAASWNLTPPVSLYYLAKLGNYDGMELKDPKTWKNWKPTVAQKAFAKPMIKTFIASYGISLAVVAMINAAIDDDDEMTEEEKAKKRAYIEYDPRSSNFMQVNSGNTHTDYFGPYRSNVVLLSKIGMRETKNSSGEIIKNGTGFGSRTNRDIVVDYLAGKANPALGVLIRNAQGGEKKVINEETGIEETKLMYYDDDVSFGYQIKHNTYPIFVKTVKAVLDEDPVLGASFYNTNAFFGKNTNVYKSKAAGTPEEMFLKSQEKKKTQFELPETEKQKIRVDDKLSRVESKIKMIDEIRIAQKMKLPYYISKDVALTKEEVADMDLESGSKEFEQTKKEIKAIKLKYGIKD